MMLKYIQLIIISLKAEGWWWHNQNLFLCKEVTKYWFGWSL